MGNISQYVTINVAAGAAGDSVSDVFNTTEMAGVAVTVVTFANACATASASLELQVSNTATTTTFKSVKAYGVYSAGTGIMTWEVPASVGAYTVLVPEGVGAFKYMRLRIAGPNTATCTTTLAQIHMYR